MVFWLKFPKSPLYLNNMTINDLISETFFEDRNFNDLTIREITLGNKHFDRCQFTNCDMSSSTFDSCTFSRCSFVSCNLSLLSAPHSTMGDSRFIDCKMIGIDWTAAEWRNTPRKKSIPFAIVFERCALDFSVFIAMDMYRVKFSSCSLREVGFESSNMQWADFTDSDLTGAHFSDTNLTAANFSMARNYTINACGNTITRAKFSMPEATALVYALEIIVE